MWPFKRKIYNPNAPKKQIQMKQVLTVALLSLAFLWFLGNLFGIAGIPPIGMVLLAVLSIAVVILVFNMVYQQSLGNKDFFLLIILVVLVIIFALLGKKYMPDLFSVALNNIQSTVGLV